ncbi:hypothetical protein BIY23_04585 [Wolbachia pipientis]|uniref:Uncharacterized protein n=2 Tax=Wolbachia pipientis TaxID=955 RepID=A0A1E7QKY1_WOLPI|nr:hypothetical protein BIY23_04585 [Wolbachia pipientis]
MTHDPKCIKILLDYGANVNAEVITSYDYDNSKSKKMSSLHLAIGQHYEVDLPNYYSEVVYILLKAGANPLCSDNNSITALQRARDLVEELINQVTMVPLLENAE